MRRFIAPLIGCFLALGLLAEVGSAQGFRRGAALTRPSRGAGQPQPPFNALTMGLNSPYAGFPPLSPVTGLPPTGAFNAFTGGLNSPYAGFPAITPSTNNPFLAGLPPITPSNVPVPNFIPPTVVRSTPGAFNPSTGAFVPSSAGAFRLSRHGGFEPQAGNFVPTPTGNFTLSVRQAVNPNTGTLFPSPMGNIVARERGSFIPAAGGFVTAATGSVNPLTGAFVPAANGSSTLASRSLFVPATGTFFATGSGPFVLSTRQAFDPLTGTFMPSSTGTFISTLRGSFVPATGSPTVFDPFGNALGNSHYYSRWLANNTYLAALQGYNPLNPPIAVSPYVAPAYSAGFVPNVSSPPMPAPYAYPYPAPNASAAYVASSYGTASSYASPTSASIPAYTGGASQSKQQPVLAAYGVPNEDGAIQWPFAFRLMTPEQKRDRLDELEAELKVAATQAAAGKPNPEVIRRAKEDVESLREWLHANRLDIAEQAYRDAEDFLANIEKGLKAMRKGY